MSEVGIPQIEYLKVKNYRALQNIELKSITPFTVFLGPNGSGKSTVFDVFAFLSESFNIGLRKAWDKRGRFKELRSRGQSGPIEFTIKYRESLKSPLITYHLAIDEGPKGPYITDESLHWKRKAKSRPFYFLRFQNGKGEVVNGDMPDEDDERMPEELSSPDMLAVNTLGQLAKHPRVGALRQFISDWYLSYLSADNTRGIAEAGPIERLSLAGDNLPNVIQFLKEQHPRRLEEIMVALRNRIPRLERIDVGVMQDGRLLMQIKDAPFQQPILAKFASDGTLKMLAYLTMLYAPNPPQLIGIEEPENHLHPRLLVELAEECRKASSNAQVFVTTHSPFFVNGLNLEEVWVIYRDIDGFSKLKQCSNMPRIKEFMKQGALLGHLWMEGHFDVGDPLNLI